MPRFSPGTLASSLPPEKSVRLIGVSKLTLGVSVHGHLSLCGPGATRPGCTLPHAQWELA